VSFPLKWLRYFLIFASAVATSYTAFIVGYSQFVLEILLYILLVRFKEHASTGRVTLLLFLAEAAAAYWLCLQYGGMLYILFLSALISLFNSQEISLRKPAALLLFVLMNISMLQEHPESALAANFIFLTAAFLLFRSSTMEVGREDLQQLYDELRKKHYELEEARKRLIEYTQMVEDSAQAEERNRIARDIHDDLGHKLIRLKMMLEAVVHIMPQNPDKGLEMVKQVRDQLADSMETMRQTVRRLKPGDDEIQSYSLDRLMENLSREPGFRVRYQTHGMPFPLYPSCEIVLYRNAQEAITNAIRHGQADEIEVHLHYNDKELLMTVGNNGKVPGDLSRRGLGLSGMEERTRIIGGSLEFTTVDGFAVWTRIPLIHK
jgi:two-component system, NarL family, sensor kinase